jgi:hypothetical protein
MMQFGILNSPIQWQICHHCFIAFKPFCYCAIKKAEESGSLNEKSKFSGVVLNQ